MAIKTEVTLDQGRNAFREDAKEVQFYRSRNWLTKHVNLEYKHNMISVLVVSVSLKCLFGEAAANLEAITLTERIKETRQEVCTPY
jgi:hypothetical protein